MASNPDFEKFVFENVVLLWPRLERPYRWDPARKESVPCQPNAQGAAFSTGWKMPIEQAEDFKRRMSLHYEACKMRRPELPEFTGIFGAKVMDGDDAGMVKFVAKKAAMSSDGEEKKPPAVIDVYHQHLANREIWTNSVASVKTFGFPAEDPKTGAGGISLMLSAVQVLEPVYGGNNFEEDFGPPKDKFADMDFEKEEPQQERQKPLDELDGDHIPF